VNRAKTFVRPLNAMLAVLLIAAWGTVTGSVPSKGDAQALAGSERKSSAFNYLESVTIDPDSGRVDLFGLENPQGPDDSIPYRQVLSEALHQPGPQFSLESDFSGFTRDSIQGKSMNGLLFTPEGKLTGFGRATLEVLHVPVGANAGQAEYVGAVLRQAGFSLAADLLQAAPPGRGFDSSALKSWIDVLFLNADYETFILARQNEAPGPRPRRGTRRPGRQAAGGLQHHTRGGLRSGSRAQGGDPEVPGRVRQLDGARRDGPSRAPWPAGRCVPAGEAGGRVRLNAGLAPALREPG